MSDVERRCGAGGRCANRERKDSPLRWVGMLLTTAAGLCEGCVRRVSTALGTAAADVEELGELIGATGSGQGAKVSFSRELPTPLRLGVDALRTEIDFECSYWAMILGWQPTGPTRIYVRVNRASTHLFHRIDELLELGPHERQAWDLDGTRTVGGQVYTGIQGALRFVDLHNRVRRVAGRTDLVHRLTPACPFCDHRALVRHNGSSHVECESCLKPIAERHYDWFVAVTIAEEERRRRLTAESAA